MRYEADFDGLRHTHKRAQPAVATNIVRHAGTALVEELDKKLLVQLRDGRKIIGFLRSFDQFANLVLETAVERIVVGSLYAEVQLGLYVVRGENVVLLGEVDEARDPPELLQVSDFRSMSHLMIVTVRIPDGMPVLYFHAEGRRERDQAGSASREGAGEDPQDHESSHGFSGFRLMLLQRANKR